MSWGKQLVDALSQVQFSLAAASPQGLASLVSRFYILVYYTCLYIYNIYFCQYIYIYIYLLYIYIFICILYIYIYTYLCFLFGMLLECYC